MKTYIKKSIPFYLSICAFFGIVIQSCDDTDYTILADEIEQHTITDIVPNIGDIGTSVIVNGTNFSATPSNNKVFVNGVSASVDLATAEQLTITIPDGATTGSIVIEHSTFTATGPIFTVVDVPTISDVDPERGPIGEVIVITGTKFSTTPADNTVTVNGIAATVTEASETSLTTSVPDGSVAGIGDITVTVDGQTGTFSGFVVEPLITDVSPLFGDAGAEVTITGTSLSATPEENIVSFNGTAATVTASTITSITTSVPVGATTGDITVTVNNLTATGPEFTVGAPPTTITVPINVEEDDVEESTVNGQMNLTSGDIELGEVDTGFSGTDGDGIPKIGLRFVNLEIPQGATISNASIQFTADSSAGTDSVEITIYGEAVDNSAPYTETPGDLSARSLTMVNVVWTITETWATDDKLPAQQTVDLSSIIQEIVNRPGWVSGNSINFVMIATGASATVTSTSAGREAEGFTDSNPGDTPELTLTYQQ